MQLGFNLDTVYCVTTINTGAGITKVLPYWYIHLGIL